MGCCKSSGNKDICKWLKAYVRKRERNNINDLSLYFRKLEKEEQGEEKIWVEIKKIETIKIEKSAKSKADSLKD